MMMIRQLVSLLSLLPAATALRGSANADVQQKERQLQTPQLMADQIAFTVLYDLLLADDPNNARPAVNGEYSQLKHTLDNWMLDMIDAVQRDQIVGENQTAWQLDTQGGSSGLSSTVQLGEYDVPYSHVVVIRYLVDFTGLTAPKNASAWVESIQQEATTVNNTLDLLATIQGVTPTDALSTTLGQEGLQEDNNLFAEAIQVATRGWRAQSSTSRSYFEESFVIPYSLTWSFHTVTELATQNDYHATRNATLEWLTTSFVRTYGNNGLIGLQSIDVTLYFAQYIAGELAGLSNTTYQQQVGLGVEILVGANKLEDVPTITNYTLDMRFLYNVTEFTEILDNYLTPDSILYGLNGTDSAAVAYAVTPSYINNAPTLSNYNDNITNTVVVSKSGGL